MCTYGVALSFLKPNPKNYTSISISLYAKYVLHWNKESTNLFLTNSILSSSENQKTFFKNDFSPRTLI